MIFRNRMKFLAAATVLLVLLLRASAVADPLSPRRFRSAATVQTDGGSTLRIPPGYFLDEPTWEKLDLQVRKLQESKTRLEAENTELRKSPGGFPVLLVTAATSFLLGVAIAIAVF